MSPGSLPGSQRSFLDTNILVYAFDNRSPKKRGRADAIIQESLDTRRGVISYQVVQEFLNVASRGPNPMPTRESRLFLEQVLWPLCEILPDAGLYAIALDVRDETGWAYYDSLIVGAAVRGGCDILLSEDLQDGRVVRGVEIRNPFKD